MWMIMLLMLKDSESGVPFLRGDGAFYPVGQFLRGMFYPAGQSLRGAFYPEGQSLRGDFYPAGQSIRLTSPYFNTKPFSFLNCPLCFSNVLLFGSGLNNLHN